MSYVESGSIKLSPEDFDAVITLIINPPKANSYLIETMKRYREKTSVKPQTD